MTTPKFGGDAVCEVLYDISLDGCNDDECGNVDEAGFYAIKFEGFSPSDFDLDQIRLIHQYAKQGQTTLRELCESAGAILIEDSQGFVRWIGYHHAELLEKAWARLVCEADTPMREWEVSHD